MMRSAVGAKESNDTLPYSALIERHESFQQDSDSDAPEAKFGRIDDSLPVFRC